MMHGGRAGNGSTNGYVLVNMVTLTALFAANYVRRARREPAAAIAPPLCIPYSWLSVLVTFMMGVLDLGKFWCLPGFVPSFFLCSPLAVRFSDLFWIFF
jgi:peptidoglycan biosynthesis protein MviN/MurJ (putative lipid II flippase)